MYWVEHKETYRDVTPITCLLYEAHTAQLPPTRSDLVTESLKRPQVVAQECGQKYALVIYDSRPCQYGNRRWYVYNPDFRERQNSNFHSIY